MFKTGDHLLQRLQATQARQAARQEQRPSQYSLQVEMLSKAPVVKVVGQCCSLPDYIPQPSLGGSCVLSLRGACGQAEHACT